MSGHSATHKNLCEVVTVTRQDKLMDGIFSLYLKTDKIASEAKPGQFVSLYTHDGSKLLPRPISICDIEGDTLRLVYRVAGFGTEEFSHFVAGDTVKIIGPLGNGFPYDGKNALLVAGGIGIPPMVNLAKKIREEYPNTKLTSVIGYRNKDTFLTEELSKYSDVVIATDDGSLGVHGNVIDAIKEKGLCADVIYACGPTPMLRGLKAFAEGNDIPCYISLEEKMACGIGACLACVCKTKEVDDHSHVNNARICKDGPVFNSKEVEL